ncbi:hypothetical protein ABPG72_018533 [Tetrahymena utriculariae]
MSYYYLNNCSSKSDDVYLYYSTTNYFNIRNYALKKESQINVLKLNLQSEERCCDFDYFSKFIKRIPNIKELEISIDIKFHREKTNNQSRVKEVFDFVIDTIIPQYQDTLEIITFTQLQIQEKSEKDKEQTIKKYLLKMLKPLKVLRVISFRQTITKAKSSIFYGLKQFILLLKEKQLSLSNLKLLDFEFNQDECQANLKLFNSKEILSNMSDIAKDLSSIKQLEELQIGIQNLGLEKIFFELLIQSIIQMKNLKKLGLDISSNRISVENSVKNVKQLQSLSNQLESFIYIDSQNFKPSNVKEFNQVMKNFSNLKFLQLEQFSFRQGLCADFFQFLSFMPHLQEIKLDLEHMCVSDNDYNYFVKQVKQLENLTLMHLKLPEEKQYLSENSVLNLIDVITHFKDQLIDFSIVLYSDIKQTENQKLINAISQMVKLKREGSPQHQWHFYQPSMSSLRIMLAFHLSSRSPVQNGTSSLTPIRFDPSLLLGRPLLSQLSSRQVLLTLHQFASKNEINIENLSQLLKIDQQSQRILEENEQNKQDSNEQQNDQQENNQNDEQNNQNDNQQNNQSDDEQNNQNDHQQDSQDDSQNNNQNDDQKNNQNDDQNNNQNDSQKNNEGNDEQNNQNDDQQDSQNDKQNDNQNDDLNNNQNNDQQDSQMDSQQIDQNDDKN